MVGADVVGARTTAASTSTGGNGPFPLLGGPSDQAGTVAHPTSITTTLSLRVPI